MAEAVGETFAVKRFCRSSCNIIRLDMTEVRIEKDGITLAIVRRHSELPVSHDKFYGTPGNGRRWRRTHCGARIASQQNCFPFVRYQSQLRII